MRTVGIVGLGLIGGSMAKAIKEHTDVTLYGYNRTRRVTERAMEEGVIHRELTYENAKDLDLLIVALMPEVVVPVINGYAPYLKKGCVIVDCTGIKSGICRELTGPLLKKGLFFVGGHPMAGKEVAGYENAEASLYANASMILCRDAGTDEEAFSKAADFFRRAGFPRIKETTPEEHDRVIAYTSQMAHVVSNAYVRSHTLSDRYDFSAGSFKDLTRVAKLNETMWAELFLSNKEALLPELKEFMEHMGEYIDAIEEEDRERLTALLREGRCRKEEDESLEAQALHKLE